MLQPIACLDLLPYCPMLANITKCLLACKLALPNQNLLIFCRGDEQQSVSNKYVGQGYDSATVSLRQKTDLLLQQFPGSWQLAASVNV